MRGSPTMVRASFAALLATLPVAIDARGEARRELAKAMDTMKEWWCDDPSTEASAICVDFETVRTAALFGASKAEKGDPAYLAKLKPLRDELDAMRAAYCAEDRPEDVCALTSSISSLLLTPEEIAAEMGAMHDFWCHPGAGRAATSVCTEFYKSKDDPDHKTDPATQKANMAGATAMHDAYCAIEDYAESKHPCRMWEAAQARKRRRALEKRKHRPGFMDL